MKKAFLSLTTLSMLLTTFALAAPLPEDHDFKNFGIYEGVDANGSACTAILLPGTSSPSQRDLSRHVMVNFQNQIALKLYFSEIHSGEGDMPVNAFYRDTYLMSDLKMLPPAKAWHYSHLNPHLTNSWSFSGYDPRIKAAATIDLEKQRSVTILITKPANPKDPTFLHCGQLKKTKSFQMERQDAE